MQYETQIEVRSDEEAVLARSAEILISCGFHIALQNENQLTLRGPGMRSTKQNPILGATEITLRRSHTMRGKLDVSADLGGVRWMCNFMTYFPPLLIGGLMTIHLVIANFVLNNMPQGLFNKLLAGAVFMLFLFLCLGQILGRRIRQNTENAIDACIRDADHLIERDH